jgi:hypothetical protein
MDAAGGVLSVLTLVFVFWLFTLQSRSRRVTVNGAVKAGCRR